MAKFDEAAQSGSSTALRPNYQRMVLASESGAFDVVVCEAVDRLSRRPGCKEAGERRIMEAEAAVVVRICRDYAAGTSPRQIARKLNEEGIGGPGGRPWLDTTVRGQPERGTGILNNSLYVGELVWNRVSYVKDPATGRREARLNPPDQWERKAVPELRIVDQALWDNVRQRQVECALVSSDNAAQARLNGTHRRRFLLSGLLQCAVCGAGYTVMAKDRYGCAMHIKAGTCSNGNTITRKALERRVLDALRDKMMAPDALAEFIVAYNDEVAAVRMRRSVSERRERSN